MFRNPKYFVLLVAYVLVFMGSVDCGGGGADGVMNQKTVWYTVLEPRTGRNYDARSRDGSAARAEWAIHAPFGRGELGDRGEAGWCAISHLLRRTADL